MAFLDSSARLTIFISAVAMLAGCASTQNTVHWERIVSPAHFKNCTVEGPAEEKSVSGTFQLSQPVYDLKWAPLVSISLVDRNDQRIYAIAITSPYGPDHPLFVGQQFASVSDDHFLELLKEIKPDEPVPFKISWSHRGHLIVEIGDTVKRNFLYSGQAIQPVVTVSGTKGVVTLQEPFRVVCADDDARWIKDPSGK